MWLFDSCLLIDCDKIVSWWIRSLPWLLMPWLLALPSHLQPWYSFYKISKSLSSSGIILCMCPANERRRYNVTSSLIGWVHVQNDPCFLEEGFLLPVPSYCFKMIKNSECILMFCFDFCKNSPWQVLTHWGLMKQICIANLDHHLFR